jgi:hypothetical protein
MRRTLIAISLAGTSALAGCAQENPGFFIQSAVALDDSCAFSASSATISTGTFDIGFNNDGTPIRPYTLNLVVRSNIISRNQGNRSAPRPDSAAVTLESADVRIYKGAPGTEDYELISGSAAERSVAVNGYVPTAVDGSPGRGAITIEAIGYQAGAALAGTYSGGDPTQLVMGVRLYGRTAGGFEVETDEWFWPFTVCDGCLRVSPPADEPLDPEAFGCTPGQNGGIWTEEFRQSLVN